MAVALHHLACRRLEANAEIRANGFFHRRVEVRERANGTRNFSNCGFFERALEAFFDGFFEAVFFDADFGVASEGALFERDFVADFAAGAFDEVDFEDDFFAEAFDNDFFGAPLAGASSGVFVDGERAPAFASASRESRRARASRIGASGRSVEAACATISALGPFDAADFFAPDFFFDDDVPSAGVGMLVSASSCADAPRLPRFFRRGASSPARRSGSCVVDRLRWATCCKAAGSSGCSSGTSSTVRRPGGIVTTTLIAESTVAIVHSSPGSSPSKCSGGSPTMSIVSRGCSSSSAMVSSSVMTSRCCR